MENKSPDWKISDLYKRSFEIVKKNKVLWIFGLIVGASISSNNFSRTFESFPSKENPNPDQFNQVLGVATSNTFQNNLTQIFSQIPSYYYFILIFEFIAFILLSIVIFIIYQAWSKASLISGINLADQGKSVSIHDSSHLAFKSVKQLIILSIFFGLIIGLLILGFAILILAGAAISSSIGFFGWILPFIGFLTFIFLLVLFSFSMIWAERKVILNQEPAKKALTSSLSITKKKFWAMILLGIVNNLVTALITAVPTIFIAIIAVALYFFAKNNFQLLTPIIVLGVILAIAAIIGITLLVGIVTSFKASVWTLAYKQIKGKYDI